MRIHREGRTILFVTLLVLFGINALLHYGSVSQVISTVAMVISVIIYGLFVQFFRNPVRTSPHDPNLVIAPADGTVVVIEDVVETEVLNEKRKQVSIFMSPLNVHVNRYPVAGKVSFAKHHPGEFRVAWDPKSSILNERTTMVVDTPAGQKILFRQIAGKLARRIVMYAKAGQQVKQGQECGFIKFGSRMDLFLPLDAEILVAIGQKPIGGETPIARLKS
jgi:phosphatidylserine decarboxylase